MRWFLWSALAIVAVALLPVGCVALSGALATANGCTLHEGFENPCIVLGLDIGFLLYALGMMDWLAIGTIPLGYFSLVALGGIWLLAHRPLHPGWIVIVLYEVALGCVWIWREQVINLIF